MTMVGLPKHNHLSMLITQSELRRFYPLRENIMEAIFGSLLMFGIVWFAIAPVKRRRLSPAAAAFHNQMLMNEWHKQGYRPYELGRL